MSNNSNSSTAEVRRPPNLSKEILRKKPFIIQGDCLEVLPYLEDNSIDLILTDPPYKYLEHKLESDFDENLFFSECKRLLKDTGFLIFFGRGSSFYRWNVICEGLGLKFIEELIWDKKQGGSPCLPIMRCHETLAVYRKSDKAKLRPVFIDKIDYHYKRGQVTQIVNDMNRMHSFLYDNAINNRLMETFKKMEIELVPRKHKHKVTLGNMELSKDRVYSTLNNYIRGKKLSSILVANKEKNYLHPTQKPISLLKLLIEVGTDAGDVVLDPFGGSGSTGEAAHLLLRNYVIIEKDKEYYDIAMERLNRMQLLLFNIYGEREVKSDES